MGVELELGVPSRRSIVCGLSELSVGVRGPLSRHLSWPPTARWWCRVRGLEEGAGPRLYLSMSATSLSAKKPVPSLHSGDSASRKRGERRCEVSGRPALSGAPSASWNRVRVGLGVGWG